MSLERHRTAIGWTTIALVLVTLAMQLVDTGDELPWLPLAAIYLSSAAIGIDAIARGVRKKAGVGPSIANLAPGGWAIFAAMFWIVAAPAYFFGARRRVGRDDDPREPVTYGSWIAIGVFALLGLVLAAVPLLK